VTALKLFNDLIIREAFARGVPLLDLRLICDRDEDYANPIEPSLKGGKKIAAAIHRVLAEHDFAAERTHVFVRGIAVCVLSAVAAPADKRPREARHSGA
jgi:hypothetical protein